ncbi:Inter-alpha-trypsin inhibitor heavy chain H4 [Saguinus oedipus]|uniref:Inter-alpha-trypsin inhibitor heavy chain H4 n=1 Tax=Saguinus oedipus TaxID=9490 RepID=A0ABQ9U4K5_SAGOE|nr:Inter-alpha-trypsin inhibitor heavy chain H4 [Saguinus oedipus]
MSSCYCAHLRELEAWCTLQSALQSLVSNRIIDGVTYPGIIKEKNEAQAQYTTAVARGRSAGLIKAAGRNMEQFQVSVSVAPNAKITFELVYEELLKRRLGVYELLLKVRPQQLVKHLQMDIHIFEPQGISFLETESTFMTNELVDALITSQNKTKVGLSWSQPGLFLQAHIRFKPTLSQQQKSPEEQETVLDGDLIIRYDVDRANSGGSIQIENGYFVHYFAPEGLTTMPKNVVFVIDKSGSMSGRKIQQVGPVGQGRALKAPRLLTPSAVVWQAAPFLHLLVAWGGWLSGAKVGQSLRQPLFPEQIP